jgi:hypothetical protein
VSSHWVSKDDHYRQGEMYRKQADEIRSVVIELAAALVRLDKNGYQERLLEKSLSKAQVKREAVDAFNEQRAETLAKWKATHGDR